MKCPRSPLIAFCFSKLGHLNISNNRAIAHNVKGERETFRKGVCDLPGLQKALQQCPIVPLLDPSLSPSHLMNGAIGRRPAAAKVQSVSSQCKLRLLPRLICTSYPTARHNNSATQCNNSSVAGKGIWVTGFLWLAQFATKLSLIGSSPLLSRIKTRIDKGKEKEKYQYKDKDKTKTKRKTKTGTPGKDMRMW